MKRFEEYYLSNPEVIVFLFLAQRFLQSDNHLRTKNLVNVQRNPWNHTTQKQGSSFSEWSHSQIPTFRGIQTKLNDGGKSRATSGNYQAGQNLVKQEGQQFHARHL